MNAHQLYNKHNVNCQAIINYNSQTSNMPLWLIAQQLGPLHELELDGQYDSRAHRTQMFTIDFRYLALRLHFSSVRP